MLQAINLIHVYYIDGTFEDFVGTTQGEGMVF